VKIEETNFNWRFLVRLEVCVWSHATEAREKDPPHMATNGLGSQWGTPMSPLYALFQLSSIYPRRKGKSINGEERGLLPYNGPREEGED
jgi:hypothetical protein